MSLKDNLLNGFNHIVDRAGLPIRVRYFNQTFDDVYDDSVILTQSGIDLWTSGIIMPINQSKGTDNLLLEQGKLGILDKKLFIAGSLILTYPNLQVKIMIGSPGENYSIIGGTILNEVESTRIYQKVYLRRLTGSLLGE